MKAHIQKLADAGIIKTPVTTYPIMWIDIASALKEVNHTELTPALQEAYYYVNHQLKLAQNNLVTLELNAAAKDKRFTSFGDAFRGKNNISLSKSYLGQSWAFKVRTNYSNSDLPGDKRHFEGSYLSGFLGNWVITFGKQDRWWGQGWDSNLSLTNNARPMSALSLTRKSAQAFNIPFTDIDVPWTVTTFMAKMDDNRIVKDTLLWGMRVNFKPFDNLEVGLTRLAQWGGEGRLQNGSTFWKLLIGKDNCGNSGRAGLDCGENRILEPGNQQAGYDLRYSNTLFGTPFALYGQYFAEDGSSKNNSSSIITEPQVQAGADIQLNLMGAPTTVFAEYIDTFADCTDKDNIVNGNCYYEHHTYQTGMRYQQRTIGSLYDNDAYTLVIGAISHLSINTQLIVKARKLTLNNDDSDKSPTNPLIGNPLTSIAEKMYMLSGKVQHSYKNWRFSLGGDISRSAYKNMTKDDNSVNIHFNVEVNL
ncbi:capsule assembly Wzi family protein [Thalassotalea ganghwensis]